MILKGQVTVGAYTRIDAGTVLTGNVTIGHHTLIRCNVTVRGNVKISNYTHIYDNVCIEGGRPAKLWSTTNEKPDQAIIGDYCWVNYGPATLLRRHIEFEAELEKAVSTWRFTGQDLSC